MKIGIALFVLLTSTFGLLGCSNQDGRYNVKNSWCAEKISPNISPKIEKITLSVDVLFKFDRSSLNDTLPEGVKQLNELVSYLSENTKDIETIKIVGYTDRIGSDNYNYTLGLARAETIKNYIVNNGINVEYIVESKGKLEPITNGCHNLRGDSLKSCLQPDRRIELFIKSRE